jgi:hypothetical protein
LVKFAISVINSSLTGAYPVGHQRSRRVYVELHKSFSAEISEKPHFNGIDETKSLFKQRKNEILAQTLSQHILQCLNQPETCA